MVALRICPICRKAVYVEAADTIVARVRGASDDLLTYFHRHCYPGDEGSLFEQVDELPTRDEPA